MGDQDRELLKWVAEELLGWRRMSDAKGGRYSDGDGRWWLDELGSWHGIGLVVEEMQRRGCKWHFESYLQTKKHNYPCEKVRRFQFEFIGPPSGKATSEKPWFAVYEAARKAVTND